MIFLEGLFRLVLPLTLAGSLAALLVLGAKALTRDRLGPGWNYYIWALPMALYVLPVPLSLGWMEAALPERGAAGSAPAAAVGGAAVTGGGTATAAAAAGAAGPAPTLWELLPVLAWVWLLGMVFSAAVRATECRSLWDSLGNCAQPARPGGQAQKQFRAVLAELGIPEGRVALVICPGVESPMITGLRKTAVILPREDYPRGQLRMMLRHELCHYRGGDLWYKAAAMAVGCIHWFNPLVKLMIRDLDRCCELRCDQRAAGAMEAGERQLYGRMLLDIAQGKTAPGGTALPLATEKNELKRRLTLLREGWELSMGTRAVSLGLALVVAVTGVVCASAVNPGPVFAEAFQGEDTPVNSSFAGEIPALWDGEGSTGAGDDGGSEPPAQPPLRMQAVLADEVTGQQAPPESSEAPETAPPEAPAEDESSAKDEPPVEDAPPVEDEPLAGADAGEEAPLDTTEPEAAPDEAEPEPELTPEELEKENQRWEEELRAQCSYEPTEEELESFSWDGGLLWPVDGGTISCGYGWYYGHTGVDIRADAGTEVYAAADGLVIYASNYSIWPYGKRVDIYHGDGVVTRYAHCSSVLVTAGDEVRQGDLIGLVGRTGNASGNHCHFEVRMDGDDRNPEDYWVK